MPRFRNGLAKVGRVYHYKFSLYGKDYHGSTGCETKEAAEQVLRRMRENLAFGKVGLPPHKVMPTLAQTLEDWTRAQAGVSVERHVANVRSAILLHLNPLLSLTLNQLGNQVVEDARTAYLNRKGRGHRPGQEGEWELAHTLGGANKVVQHLSSVVGWAVRRGVLERMPFQVVPLKPKPTLKGILWPELVQAFLVEADRGRRYPGHAFPHSATAMRLMLQLGLREDEALGARWEWLDRRRRVYMVGQAKDRQLREIPVPDSLLEHLDRVLGPWAGVSPSGFILRGPNGEPHGPGFTAKPMGRCAEEIGLQGLHPHRLRASFATTHFEAGTPLSQIQQMMGHEDPATTQKYIVQRPKDQAAAQERVSELMGFTQRGGFDVAL